MSSQVEATSQHSQNLASNDIQFTTHKHCHQILKCEDDAAYSSTCMETVNDTHDAASEQSFKQQENKIIPPWLHIDNMPEEIILGILEHLPVEDAMSYALCDKARYENRRVLETLGALIYDDQARKILLERLRRDMDQGKYLMICEVCEYPHPVPQRCKGSRAFQRKCDEIEQLENSSHYFHHEFGFGDVQVILQMHHSGDAKALQKYLSDLKGLWAHPTNPFAKVFEVAIGGDNNVYIRKQEWFFFTSKESKIAFPRSQFRQPNVNLCSHIDSRGFTTRHEGDIQTVERAMRFLKMLGKMPTWVNGKLTKSDLTWTQSQIFACEKCPTEYQIHGGLVSKPDERKLDERKPDERKPGERKPDEDKDAAYAIVVTKWMCLGDGLTRFGGLWRRHCQDLFEDTAFQAMPVRDEFQQTSGEIDYMPVCSDKLKDTLVSWRRAGARFGQVEFLHKLRTVDTSMIRLE